MSFTIEQRIMSGLPNYPLTTYKYVIAHESGNAKNCDEDALEKELSFMARNKANAFVSHWVGGGGRIVQVAPVGKLQYGCGPKGNPYCYAQVELARTNNKKTFEKDYAAYVWLLRKLAKDAGLPITLDGKGNGIKSHRWITNNLGGTDHVDPYSYLINFGITEEKFKHDIENGLEEELTVSQYNELKKIIDAHSLRIEKLEKHAGYEEREVDETHKESWDWATEQGLVNGKYPNRPLTREQFASIEHRKAHK